MPSTPSRACLTAAILLAAVSPAAAQRSTPVRLLHPSGAADDWLGFSAAIDGDTAVVGAWRDDVGANTNQGSALVFRRVGTGWTLEATLVAPDGASSDLFGSAVAISGNTIVVGAEGDNIAANSNQGSAYVFTRAGSSWTFEAKLTAAGGAADDEFGTSVAIHGDTAVIGADLDDVGANTNQGSAHVFTRTGATWTLQATLTAADGAIGDAFGSSVAVDADTILVGSHSDDVSGQGNQGSAYVYARSGTIWTQQAKLTAAGGAPSDNFGISVAIAGETAVVGAHLANFGTTADQGLAYVFTRTGTIWTQQAQLAASDGTADDAFGRSVAIAGDTVIVGAYLDDPAGDSNRGSAYIFVRSGTTWTQQTHLAAAEGAAGDFFGYAVAVSGDVALVSAYSADVAGANQGLAWIMTRAGSTWVGPDHQVIGDAALSGDEYGYTVGVSGDIMIVCARRDSVGANSEQGSVYIFTRAGPGSPWLQETQLLAPDGAAGDHFGLGVAVSGNTAVVGAPYDDGTAGSDTGSVYVFVRAGTTWSLQQKLTLSSPDAAANDDFGISVSISGDTLIAGCRGDDTAGSAAGSAYIFTRSGATWSLQQKLTATGGAANDQFGYVVSIDGDTAVVGAPFDDVLGLTDRGSAYVFVRSGGTWGAAQQLFPPDGAANDWFGYSVAISGTTAVVSAFADDVGTNIDQGSVHIYSRQGSSWFHQVQLIASDGAAFDYFGSAVAVSAATLLIGAHGDDLGIGSDQGSTYVFARLGVAWAQAEKLAAPDGSNSDRFGNAAAISSDTAVVGAFRDSVGGNVNQGSAYAFGIVHGDLPIVRKQVVSLTQQSTVNGQFINVGPPPNMQFGGAAVRRISDLQLIATLAPSTLLVENTQTVAAGGGQTGGGFVDGALRVAETSGGVTVSFGTTLSGATVIDIHQESRKFLAAGYSMEGSIGTSIVTQPAVFDITDAGPLRFATYYTGTAGFFTGSLTAVEGGGGLISGNLLTPGRYSLSTSPQFPNVALSSTSPPQDEDKDGLFRVVLLKRCLEDFNNSGATTVQDLFEFLAAYFAGDPRADVNAVNGLSVQDIFDFLAAFFSPC